jgi:hypothetical protein
MDKHQCTLNVNAMAKPREALGDPSLGDQLTRKRQAKRTALSCEQTFASRMPCIAFREAHAGGKWQSTSASEEIMRSAAPRTTRRNCPPDSSCARTPNAQNRGDSRLCAASICGAYRCQFLKKPCFFVRNKTERIKLQFMPHNIETRRSCVTSGHPVGTHLCYATPALAPTKTSPTSSSMPAPSETRCMLPASTPREPGLCELLRVQSHGLSPASSFWHVLLSATT